MSNLNKKRQFFKPAKKLITNNKLHSSVDLSNDITFKFPKMLDSGKHDNIGLFQKSRRSLSKRLD